MTTQPPAPVRRKILSKIAVAAVVGLVVFAVLWYLVFSAVTAALFKKEDRSGPLPANWRRVMSA